TLVGKGIEEGTKLIGKGCEKLGEVMGRPLTAAIEKFNESHGAAKVGMGVVVALAGVLKGVGSVVSISGKTVEAAGKVAGSGCELAGSAAKVIGEPLTGKSYQNLAKATVDLGTN